MGHEALPADRDDEVDGGAEGIQQTPVLEARLELEVASVAELAVHPHKARRHAALGDGLVDVNDILVVIGAWATSCNGCSEDLDGSGFIDVNDLLLVIASW